MIRKFVLVFLAFFAVGFLLSKKANAELIVHTMGVHVGSQHFPASSWNNVNPGIYFRGTINNAGWASGDYVVGSYYNSERKGSAYVGYVYPVSDHFDMVVGAITGYKAAPVLPMVVPSVHFLLVSDVELRIHYLPKIDKGGAHVVHLSLERRF